jgi:hypothetical protein
MKLCHSYLPVLLLLAGLAWGIGTPASAQVTLELDASSDDSKSLGTTCFPQSECVEREYKSIYSQLDPNDWSTGVLRERVFSVHPIEKYDGIDSDTTFNKGQWTSIYSSIYEAAADKKGLTDPSTLTSTANQTADHVAPVAIVFNALTTIDPNAYNDGRLTVNTSTKKVEQGPTSGSPYAANPRLYFAVQSLTNPVRGRDVTFDFDLDYYTTNTGLSLQDLKADFGDGMGMQDVMVGSRVSVSYADLTTKVVAVEAKIGGEWRSGSFELDLRQEQMTDEVPDSDISNTNATATINGVSVGYQYHGYYGAGNSSIEKPVIFLDGFDPNDRVDPDNARGLNDIYNNYLNRAVDVNGETKRAATTLLNEGHDLFVLNYEDGGRSITENAYALVDLINIINAKTNGEKAITVIGPSMGGLVSRYALLYMEDNNLTHNVELWISFDSPHLGANVPVGLQKMMRLFPIDIGPIAKGRDRLSVPAARELIVYNSFNNQGTSDPLRTNFLNDLEAMGGYPSQPRKVALANGNGYGDYLVSRTGDCFTPSYQTLYPSNKIFHVELLDQPLGIPLPYEYHLDAYAAPNNQEADIYRTGHYLKIDVLFGEIKIKVGGIERSVNTPPLDSAPGGWRAFTGNAGLSGTVCSVYEGDAIGTVAMEFLAEIAGIQASPIYDYETFIPTVSALAYNTSYPDAYSFGSQDFTYPVMNDSQTEKANKSPFDRIFAHSNDTQHVRITSPVYQIVLEEIRNLYGPDYLVLENETVAGDETFVASKEITVRNSFTIASGATVDARAGEKVRLEPGFHAESGSNFHAFIGTALEPTPMNTSTSSTTLATKSTDLGGSSTETEDTEEDAASSKQARAAGLPATFSLEANYPNPFRNQTTLRYGLPDDARVTITVYNLLGQRIAELRDRKQRAGFHTVEWDALNQASGTYLVRMQAGEHFSDTQKMTLVR